MRFLALVLAVLCHVALGALPRNHIGALNHGLVKRGIMLGDSVANDGARYYDQKVDHYDPTYAQTWRQKYYVNDTFWKAGSGPIFFVLGGEGPVSNRYVGDRFVTGELSAQFNALVVALEHRFYGESYPVNDSSTHSLRLLSSQQALADAARFRQFFGEQIGCPDCPWIAFGGSYSGALSAWLKHKYPELFVGSLSSSAPVNAVEDFTQYFEVVSASLGTTCSNVFKKAVASLESMVATDAGRQKVASLFNLCAAPANDQDLSVFFESISDPVCGVVQYNNDNRGPGAVNIDDVCSFAVSSADPVQAWADIVRNQTGGECLDVSWSGYLQQLAPSSDARSWTWQTCTEYGYFQTGESSLQPFSSRITLQFFRDICQQVYGQGVPAFPDTAWTNAFYGGLNIKQHATNTFFSDGTVDPWHALAVLPYSGQPGTQSLPGSSSAVLITGTAHCADLYASSPDDLPDLTAARGLFRIYLSQWLDQAAIEKANK